MPPFRRSARTASSTAARESAHPYTRANRQISPGSSRPSASIARPANGKTSLRLTVKAPPSKLRQATSGSQVSAPIPPNPYADPSESDATPAPGARTARATRNPRTVVEPESEEDEEEDDAEEEEEQEEDGEEAEDVDQELLANEDSEEDAEAEDDDEDEEMEDAEDEHPPPPIIKQQTLPGKTKPNVTVTAPPEGPLQSVEAKEMDDEEDEELSELDSNENDEEDEEEDSSGDDDDEDNSRAATPDLSKLTRRQRGFYDETAEAGLMALSNEAQKKKHLTAEEHAMRRAEMARRRKNLSEKRNEEEKVYFFLP